MRFGPEEARTATPPISEPTLCTSGPSDIRHYRTPFERMYPSCAGRVKRDPPIPSRACRSWRTVSRSSPARAAAAARASARVSDRPTCAEASHSGANLRIPNPNPPNQGVGRTKASVERTRVGPESERGLRREWNGSRLWRARRQAWRGCRAEGYALKPSRAERGESDLVLEPSEGPARGAPRVHIGPSPRLAGREDADDSR
jgi:hypothetical protein